MLSLGTEFDFAFAMASASVGLPAGSPPPARADISIVLINLANSLPRRASTTAFLCLVVAHLECPLTGAPRPSPAPLPAGALPGLIDHADEEPVHTSVAGELGVKGRGEQVALPDGDDPTDALAIAVRVRLLAVEADPTEHLDVGSDRLDHRCADENRGHRSRVEPGSKTVDLDDTFEGVYLPTEGIAPDHDIHAANQRLIATTVQHPVGQENHAGAGPVRREPRCHRRSQRLQQVEYGQQLADRGGLAAREQDAVDAGQLARPANRDGQRPGRLQRCRGTFAS